MTHSFSRTSARRYVLDANALIGFFEDRRKVSEKVRHLLSEALRLDVPLFMSAINWGEVFYIAWRRHGEVRAHESEAKLQQLPIAVIGVDRERATRAAALKQKHALGYADAFAAELAIEQSAWLVTADPEFGKLGEALSVYSLPRPSRDAHDSSTACSGHTNIVVDSLIIKATPKLSSQHLQLAGAGYSRNQRAQSAWRRFFKAMGNALCCMPQS